MPADPTTIHAADTVTVHAADGVSLHVTTSGPDDARVAVVYLHGWCLSSQIFRHQYAALRELSRTTPPRMVTYDLRGHGRSSMAPRDSTTIAQLAEDLHAVLDETCGDLPTVLVGHSIGGMTIMALAEWRPQVFRDRVAGVVFVNTAAGDLGTVRMGLPRSLAGFARGALTWEFARRRRAHLRRGDPPARRRLTDSVVARRILFGRAAPRDDVRLCRRLISTTHPAVVEGFFADLARHRRHEALAQLADVPVRILAGEEDRLTPLRHSIRIAEALPAARMTVFPGAGHMLPLERSHELATEVVSLVRSAVGGR